MKGFLRLVLAFMFLVGAGVFTATAFQEKPPPSIPVEDIATLKNPQITTILTGFRVGNNIRSARLVKETWTPTRIEREWVMPVIVGDRWQVTEDSKRWIEIIVIEKGKLKLSKKGLLTKEYEMVNY